MSLVQLMTVNAVVKDDYSWLRCTIPGGAAELQSAAENLAERVLMLRCGAAASVVDVWRESVHAGRILTDEEKKARVAFIGAGFGSPLKQLPPAHIEGMTAEYLWYFATSDYAAHHGIDVVRIEKPGLSPTSTGGDGLVMIRENGSLGYFLWEIKKNTGQAHVSRTIARAYDQLDSNALDYLARYVGAAGAEANEADVQALLASMVQDWITSSGTAGAGVAVAPSFTKTPRSCFSTFPNRFPDLKPRLRGVVFGLGDFPAFATAVKELLWTAL